MPFLAEIRNIKIYIYPNDHNPPHIHCYKDDHSAVIDIRTGIVIVGDMRSSDLKEVREWVEENRSQLLQLWKK